MYRNQFLCFLQLSVPAQLNANVQPAPLPTIDTPELTGGTSCTVSGWGVTRIYSFYLSPVLRAVDVEIIPNCQYYYYYRVNDNMICAGSRFGGKDSCQVTSGLSMNKVQFMWQNCKNNDALLLYVHESTLHHFCWINKCKKLFVWKRSLFLQFCTLLLYEALKHIWTLTLGNLAYLKRWHCFYFKSS